MIVTSPIYKIIEVRNPYIEGKRKFKKLNWMSLKILCDTQQQIPFEGDLPFCFIIVSLLKRGLDLSSNVSARCPSKVGKME